MQNIIDFPTSCSKSFGCVCSGVGIVESSAALLDGGWGRMSIG